jgi:hypothetical protein
VELADRDILQFANCDGRSSFIFPQRWSDQVSNSRDSNYNAYDAPHNTGCCQDEVSAAEPVRTRHAHLLDESL